MVVCPLGVVVVGVPPLSDVAGGLPPLDGGEALGDSVWPDVAGVAADPSTAPVAVPPVGGVAVPAAGAFPVGVPPAFVLLPVLVAPVGGPCFRKGLLSGS